MSKVYLAGPLFNAAEKEFNVKICDILEEAGYEVFLPQRDGILSAETENIPKDEVTKIIFEKDTEAILQSDILVFVTDGRVPDDGACVELGIAYAKGKRCYGIRTDVRTLEDGLPLNPLIAGCFKKVFSDCDSEKLYSELKQYLSENPL